MKLDLMMIAGVVDALNLELAEAKARAEKAESERDQWRAHAKDLQAHVQSLQADVAEAKEYAETYRLHLMAADATLRVQSDRIAKAIGLLRAEIEGGV